MESIYEILGENIIFAEDEKYYALDIKKKGIHYYCLGINIDSKSLAEGAQILRVNLEDGELMAGIYIGEERQSLLDEFMEPENLVQRLPFMYIQIHALAEERKKKEKNQADNQHDNQHKEENES